MPQKLFREYEKLVAAGKIRNDEAQRQVLALLQESLNTLNRPKRRFFSPRRKHAPSLYIWGDVGRGKSMLMDLFFAAANVEKKRRVHFHAFMQEVHARIHEIRKRGLGDPVSLLAKQIASEVELLCFDELQATDVTDASLLHRLFSGLFSYNICIISTSNRPPEQLYTGGVQAERFASFISLLKEKTTVITLNANTDYRYLQGETQQKNYHFPLGAEANEFIEDTLENLGVSEPATLEKISVHGRELIVKTYSPKIAFFTFHELCETALGAADYLEIARRFPVVILANIPALTPEKRNEAKRFTTLIDALYEHKNRLFYTSEVPPEKIYASGDGSFEFQRTVSRLVEMGSAGYNHS